jgi:hypothetical protein
MNKLHTNPVTWFEIYASDLQRAKNFYESVFDYTLSAEETDGSFEAFRFPGTLPGSGAIGSLMHHPMRKPSKDGTLVYFHCDDCAVRVEKTLRNGGQVLRAKWSIGREGFIAIIEDTEGNAIGLHSFD